jgi:hypothetical protein
MDRYVTPALGTTIIPGGTWKFTMYAKLNIAQKEGMLKVSINRVDLNGTILSELGTAESDFFSNTLVVPIIISKYLGEQIGWDATDRIGIIVSGKRGAEDGATVTWYHDAASGWASIMETPVTLLHNQMQGLNDGDYKHLTANEKLGFNNLSGHYIQKVSPPSGQTIAGGPLVLQGNDTEYPLIVKTGLNEILFGYGRMLTAFYNGALANFDFKANQIYFDADLLLAEDKKFSTSNGSTQNLYLTTNDATKVIYTDRILETTGGVKFPDGTTQTSAIIDEGEF